MVLGCLAKQPIGLPCLTTQSGVIEHVTTFKLLGITLWSDLSWEAHINAICARVAPHLYYLKQLTCAGLPSGDLLYFYLTVIRPVLEYGCVVWHHGLTVAQSQKLESLQKRTLRIIHQIVYDWPYDSACAYAGVQSLSARRFWEGGSFVPSQYPTAVYMTFFPNDEIRKFFPGFDDTLSIQYHELKAINIVLSYTMPWPNINNLII